ncbi:MAG: phosphonate ABC transporter, permease protein PhnE [Anaerorhabdus sp.]
MSEVFNKIFKPEIITLTNGKTIIRKRSILPLIYLIIILVIISALKFTEFDVLIIFERISQMGTILKKIFNPNFAYFPSVIGPLIDTIQMSFIGTFIGIAVGLPVSVLSASNINKNKVIVSITRFILGIIRTVPTLIMATVFSLIFGLGTFAGTVAIALFTFGIISKMMFESIETIDLGPFMALQSLGCNKFEAFWKACMPQILPTYISHSLYCFEVNVRAAAILGYVGAGGLGILINERIGWREYNDLGMILLTLFIVVFLIERLSSAIRRRLT